MGYEHQDWTPVVIHNKSNSKTSNKTHQNPAGTKERQRLESDEIYTLNKMTAGQAKILRDARCAKGITQKDFAKKISKDVSIIQQYENGSVPQFSLQFYKYLLKNLNVKYEEGVV
jgi:ribosome-binding protein aMBF1 (putative translation factor)